MRTNESLTHAVDPTGGPGLRRVAERYRRAMALAAPGSLSEFPLTDYDRIGIPVQATVWDDGVTDAHGVGYGASTSAASVGALGELAERVLLRSTLRELPARRAGFESLRKELGESHVADPAELIIDATADYTPDRPLWWVPATRLRTGETVWIPAEFAAFDASSMPSGAERDHLITPITNGMGAGDSVARAVGHGLLELVQRDGDNVVFRALDRGRVIDVDADDVRDRSVRSALAAIRAAGIDVMVKLASTEFACVTYCVGRDCDPEAPVTALGAIGEAAHPDRDVSVAKSLLEFASSRARRIFAFGPLDRVARLSPDYLAAELHRPVGEQEPRAFAEMRRWTTLDRDAMNAELAPIFGRSSTVSFTDLPTTHVSDPENLLQLMLSRLADYDVLAVLSQPRDGMHAAKVLAPGLEVESLSYLRIGPRAFGQLRDLDLGLVGTGAPGGPGRVELRLRDRDRDALGHRAWVDRAAVARVVDRLYPLYREPRRHAVQRSELDAP